MTKADDIQPMSIDLLRRLQTLLKNDDPLITQIADTEFYAACLTLEIPLPTKAQRATTAGRMHAIMRLRKFFGQLKDDRPLGVKAELREIHEAIRGLQWEIQKFAPTES